MPQVKTSSMNIYSHIWLKQIWQHMFWSTLGFMVISRTKNWSNTCQKYRFCLPWILSIQSGASIVSRYILDDYLLSHMIKMICQNVLWPVLVYMVISKTKTWSKIFQIHRMCSPIPSIRCGTLNIKSKHLQWLFIVIYDWNWYIC